MKLQPDEQKLVDDVSRYGWHCLAINDGPMFAYSIGLMQTYDHAELIVCGVDPTEHGVPILESAVECIAEGSSFEGEASSDDVIQVTCHFRDVHPSQLPEYFGYAIWYERYLRFLNGQDPRTDDLSLRAVQLFLPDRHGVPIWDPACDVTSTWQQPRLDHPLT